MRDMPRDFAREVYLKSYWRGPRFDDVAQASPAIAEELFDTGVNMGQGDAARFLQRALNALNQGGALYADIAVDGHVGDRTLDALEAYRRAYRYAPGDVELTNDYLDYEQEYGNSRLVLQIRQELAERRPADLRNRRELAIMLAERERYDEARQVVEALVAIHVAGRCE